MWKSEIFVNIASGKGTVLFYFLTKTTAIRVGDKQSPALFIEVPNDESPN